MSKGQLHMNNSHSTTKQTLTDIYIQTFVAIKHNQQPPFRNLCMQTCSLSDDVDDDKLANKQINQLVHPTTDCQRNLFVKAMIEECISLPDLLLL